MASNGHPFLPFPFHFLIFKSLCSSLNSELNTKKKDASYNFRDGGTETEKKGERDMTETENSGRHLRSRCRIRKSESGNPALLFSVPPPFARTCGQTTGRD